MKFKILDNELSRDLELYAKSYIETLTKEEIEAIKNYTSDYYIKINNSLRKNHILEEVYLIDSALNKFNYDKTFTVYRKLYVFYDKFEKYIKTIEKKGLILDKGFQSTSLNQNMFVLPYYNVFLELEINNPNCGAYISPLSNMKFEQEFLIKRNTLIEILDFQKEPRNGITKIKGRIR